MNVRWKLLLICLGALALRLLLLTIIEHPGIGDPNHYYNLAQRLVAGQGFTIDYIWQFYNPPDSIVHPEDFWMPLPGLLAALPLWVGGTGVQASILSFTVLGSLLPLCGYWAARQLDCSEAGSLFAAASVAVLPEFVLNSVRTDTTVPNTLFVCLTILALTAGLRSANWKMFALSGLAAGLAYLTRGDSLLLLPMLVATLIVYYAFYRPRTSRWWMAVLVPAIALLVIAPWLLRNLQVGGSLLTPNLNRLFFLVDFRDHYAYGRDFTLDTLLATQTIPQIISKRLFEMAASVKTIYITLDVFLPVMVIGGGFWLVLRRDRQRLLTLAPALILLAGSYVFYTILAPIANQGGSFKKAYLSLLPLLIPIGAYLIDQLVTQRGVLRLVLVIATALMTANAVELVRADVRFVRTYLDYMGSVAEKVNELGDANGDGAIIVMAQDPFMLRFFDIQSVVIPMESREIILAVAERYGVDYLMMPPARPALDALFEGRETDPRFVPLADLPAINVRLYGFQSEAA